jgi:hypothetical protein
MPLPPPLPLPLPNAWLRYGMSLSECWRSISGIITVVRPPALIGTDANAAAVVAADVSDGEQSLRFFSEGELRTVWSLCVGQAGAVDRGAWTKH